jgi:hypothetical protein
VAAAIASAIPATAQAAAQAAAHPAWRIAYTLPGGTATVLDGIAAASQNDAWAFGVTYYGPHYKKQKVAYFHWNGKHWRPASVSAPAGFVPLTIQADSQGDLWMIGEVSSLHASYPLALHLVGRTWHRVAMPNGAQTTGAFVSRNGIWAVGQQIGCPGRTLLVCTEVLHWNGSSWSSYTVGGEIKELTGWATTGGPPA